MKIIEYTYPNGTHSYSTGGGATLLVDNIAPVSQKEYEVDDASGKFFMENPTKHTFEKGVVNAKP